MTFSFHRELGGAVLFDRDGTLVHDVPLNRDPGRVEPVDGARHALALVREAGLGAAVVTNQPILGDGRASRQEVDRVNSAVEEQVGPFDAWFICPHTPDDSCACRKPAPGLIFQAQRFFALAPDRLVVIGDIGSDVEAARAAGCHGILVPTLETRDAEVEAAETVAPDLVVAVEWAVEMLAQEEVAQ